MSILHTQKTYHPILVPGLDVLIGDPDILSPSPTTKKKADYLTIPGRYIYRIKDFYDEPTNRGDSCRELANIIWHMLDHINHSNTDYITLPNGMRVNFYRPKQALKNFNSSKEQAVVTATELGGAEPDPNVAIMTGSDKLAMVAAFAGLEIAQINPDVYTGRRTMPVPPEYASLWWRKGGGCFSLTDWQDITEIYSESTGKEVAPLHCNEYIELLFSDDGSTHNIFQNIARFDGQAIVPLRFTHIKDSPAYRKIYPRTAGQAMLFDALLTPADELPIVIVSGIFGTGKTFVTTTCGLSQVEENLYDEIFICPRDSSLGQDIGFVPGDVYDKTIIKARPIVDNLRAILRFRQEDSNFSKRHSDRHNKSKNHDQPESPRAQLNTLVEKMLANYFEFEPIINMGGRSIQNAYFVLDEFQDTERRQAKALLSRIGNHTKMIILGDPTQVTNTHLNRTSNGLSYVASKMAGDPLTAVITFNDYQEVIRSAAALHIAERLSS